MPKWGKRGLRQQVEDLAEIWPKIVHYLRFKNYGGITNSPVSP